MWDANVDLLSVYVSERCYNEHDSWQCNVWAGQGECERNSDFMHRACQKACHRCGKDEDEDATRGRLFSLRNARYIQYETAPSAMI